MASKTRIEDVVGGYERIFGYRQYLPLLGWPRKRALLSYLTDPILAKMRGDEIVRFSNSGIALSWSQVLNELGYLVDIINWQDKEFVPDGRYDLVVFHGGKNFNSVYPSLKGQPKIIHFLTGSYWRFNNEAEDARIKDFQKRHKVKVDRDRYIYASEDPVNEASDGIIVLGDPSMRLTYPKKYQKVLTINNASYPDGHFDKTVKDYSKAKNNFLFFAGSGNIHKGLDLLIDSFKDLTQQLFIVGPTDKKVMAVFRKEMQLPNIHLVGEVNMRTAEFYEVMNKCAFVILPSCSEGQAGSVVEAMNQGLIPIVSKETRLDARNYGAVLANNSITCIKKVVRQMSGLEPKEVKAIAEKVRSVVLADHSPEHFRKSLKKAVLRAISQ